MMIRFIFVCFRQISRFMTQVNYSQREQQCKPFSSLLLRGKSLQKDSSFFPKGNRLAKGIGVWQKFCWGRAEHTLPE